MKKFIIATIFASLFSNCIAAGNTDIAKDRQQFNINTVAQQEDTNYITSMEYVTKAYTAYIEARTTGNDIEANEKYVVAINYISKAVDLDKSNAEAWLLGAQIYRSRGGISYAKDYFAHAKACYEKELVENISNPNAKLRYAIACYAGDARYLSDSDDYKLGAYIAANEALKLIAIQEQSGVKNNHGFSKLMAHIILQDQKVEDSLKIVNDSYNKESIEFRLANNFYADLVVQGKWLWPVSSRENAEKEFLLYCITQLS